MATAAKAAKKNIWKAVTLMPLSAILPITPSFMTLRLTISTHRLPTVVDRFQKLMMAPFIETGAWL